MQPFGRIAFVKATDYDRKAQYWGIVKVKHNKTISLDFHPYSIMFYFGKKYWGNCE